LLEHDLFRKPVSTFRDHALIQALKRLRGPADTMRLGWDVVKRENPFIIKVEWMLTTSFDALLSQVGG
jgi:hypothetical protein